MAMADEHRDAGAMGDSEWFGVSAAILAGDLAFVWADELIETAAVDEAALARARQVFTTLRSEVIAGQHLDLVVASTRDAREADARKVALLKSARYTVTRPLLLGAALAGGATHPDTTQALVDYGDAVGLAFQMRDDILGVFGDPGVTGKSRLDDLREGKRTVLVLRAHRLADPAGQAELERSLGRPDLDEAGAARCRDVIASSGALASVEALLADRHDAALFAIERLPDEPRRALTSLAASAIDRLR
jgi:geranylgeranyl diphosphate synthase type I